LKVSGLSRASEQAIVRPGQAGCWLTTCAHVLVLEQPLEAVHEDGLLALASAAIARLEDQAHAVDGALGPRSRQQAVELGRRNAAHRAEEQIQTRRASRAERKGAILGERIGLASSSSSSRGSGGVGHVSKQAGE